MDAPSDRKAAALQVDDRRGTFETTPFGRRRVNRVPAPLALVWRVISWPFRFVGRRFAGRSEDGGAK
jgi:hypothetical protein